MRLYLVAPAIADNDDRDATDHQLHVCSERIADLILSHVSADPALFAMRSVDEGCEAPVKPDTRYGDAEVVHISDSDTLRSLLAQCGDPNSGKWMFVRSCVRWKGPPIVCRYPDRDPLYSDSGSRDQAAVGSEEECRRLRRVVERP
jgi:hypothetical protein